MHTCDNLMEAEHCLQDLLVLHVSLQDTIPQVGDIAIQLQRFPNGMRTVGYDVPAVDWTHYESDAAATAAAALMQPAEQAEKIAAAAGKAASGGCSCGHAGAHKHAAKQQQQPTAAAAAVAAATLGLSPERLQSLQQQLQDIAQQRRVVGYNVPALDQQQLFLEKFTAQQKQQQSGASSAANAATTAAAAAVSVATADSASRVQQDRQLYDRKYFKSPCNNPEARQLFKNSKNHPLDRSYYKNPANAPVLVQDMPQPLQVCCCANSSTPPHLRQLSTAFQSSVTLSMTQRVPQTCQNALHMLLHLSNHP
jgi:hypothetical protein